MSGYTVKLRGVQRALREYACEVHGAFEVEVDLATSVEPRPCPVCAVPCGRTLESHIATRMAVGVFRGKGDGPRGPLDMDTRPLAEGKVTLKEFRKQRRALHRDNRRAEAKQKGLLR